MAQKPIKEKALIIGLSGGIASGKTAASDYFQQLGVPVIDADVISRDLLSQSIHHNPNSALLEVKAVFGESVFDHQGFLDRAKMREIVFNDEQKKATLEKILHPKVFETIKTEVEACDSHYVIVSVPLLTETARLDFYDRIVIVDVSEEIQLKRCLKLDNSSVQTIKNIIASQATRSERLSIADDVIENSRDLAHLHQQIDKLHQFYRAL